MASAETSSEHAVQEEGHHYAPGEHFILVSLSLLKSGFFVHYFVSSVTGFHAFIHILFKHAFVGIHIGSLDISAVWTKDRN